MTDYSEGVNVGLALHSKEHFMLLPQPYP